jgi:hypothetical protein
MTGGVRVIEGCRVLCYAGEGRALASADDALDVISAAMGGRTDLVWIPVEHLDPRFFDLSTGVAGVILQKLVNYGLRVAVLGDIAPALRESKALRDFVRESNRGRQIWFVASEAELAERLGASR